VVALSARFAASPQELAGVVRRRLAALAQAHALTLPTTPEAAGPPRETTTLHALIDAILRPYQGSAEAARVTVTGADATLAGNAVTGFALLLHELATNAAKYGALSTPEGIVEIACAGRGDEIMLTWTERGGPPVGPPGAEGFGTRLGQATVRDQLGGSIAWDFRPAGVTVRLRVPRDRLAG
jgi:two-component sensor histidine kinase